MGWFRRSKSIQPVEFGCDFCAHDHNRYCEHVSRIGFDDFRGIRLLRCPRCESLYEETPSGHETRRLSVAEAKTRFFASAFDATEQQVVWHRVYSLTDDPEHIEQLQEVSLDRSDFGLAPDPLVASDEWWIAIDSGRLPAVELDGEVEDVFWGSMNDWPSCRVRDESGENTTWTREGEYRRYVEGLRIRIRYVTHDWKRPGAVVSAAPSRVVLSVDVEESRKRSGAIAPGPGDIGYELARREGAVFHYLVPNSDFADLSRTRAAIVELGGQLSEVGKGPRVALKVTFDSADEATSQKSRLAALGEEHGYAYDGGQIVGGAVINA